MRGMVPPDPETDVSQLRFAVVSVPRRSRNRFAASCVHLKDSEQQALAEEDPASKLFAAQVVGPSKSSEGVIVYYLARWLRE